MSTLPYFFFKVLQESIEVSGTKVHLVYHSSETEGYKSVILIQMTPDTIPTNLALVHLKVYVQGIENVRVFEADPGLKHTFSWDRINAYRQKVYGIVPVKVHVGYEYKGCNYVFWEVRSTTMTGFDLTSSEIGGWNLDVHHTYNFQEGRFCDSFNSEPQILIDKPNGCFKVLCVPLESGN